MSQIRWFDTLASHDDDRLKSQLQNILHGGVYEGMEISLPSGGSEGILSISRGKYLSSNGMIVEETSDLTLPLPDTGSGSLGKTLVSSGVVTTTVQRVAHTYSLVSGLLSDADFVNSNIPYTILGWVNYNGTSWSFSSAPKQNKISFVPTVKFPLPVPGFGANFGIVPYIGPSQEVEIPNPSPDPIEFFVPLNNEFPIRKLFLNGVFSHDTTVLARLEDLNIDDISFPPVPVYNSVVPAGFQSLEFIVPQANMLQALLIIKMTGIDAVLPIIATFKLTSFSYFIDLSFI